MKVVRNKKKRRKKKRFRDHPFPYLQNRAMTLTVLPLISEVSPSTARGISDSQVTDGEATETDDSGRWRWRQRDGMEKDGCLELHQHY